MNNEYHSPLYQEFRHRNIDAIHLAGQPVKMFFAEIDGYVDFDIKPSKYAAIVIRRIKRNYYYQKYPPCLK